MTISVFGGAVFGGVTFGGSIASSSEVAILFVDPTAASLVSTTGNPGDPDPTAFTVIDTPSAAGDPDPTQVAIIE